MLANRIQNDFIAIYGNSILKIDEKHSKILRNRANPKYRMPFCHQSVFVRTDILKRYKFDTSFRICADNDFFTKLYNAGYRFYASSQIVSIYDANGISSKPNWQFFKEELRIGSKYNRWYILIFVIRYAIMVAKYLIKSILPRKLANKLSSKYNAK